MPYFHLRLDAPRPTFPFDATAEEGAAMGRHSAFWREQAASGRAVAVGPVFDAAGPFGMALVEVENEAEAEALAAADPVIQAELGFRYTVSAVPSLILRAAAHTEKQVRETSHGH